MGKVVKRGFKWEFCFYMGHKRNAINNIFRFEKRARAVFRFSASKILQDQIRPIEAGEISGVRLGVEPLHTRVPAVGRSSGDTWMKEFQFKKIE